MRRIFCLAFLMVATAFAFATNLSSPVGYWKQYDDKTGQLQSIMQIYKANDGTLNGKVVTGFEIKGKAPNLYCTACEGALHNHRIAGMTIMTGMKEQDGYWQGGHILDPNSGSVYKAEMRLFDGGEKLGLRGYIGISLFGRSQTWVRLPQKDLPALMKKAYPQPKQLYLK